MNRFSDVNGRPWRFFGLACLLHLVCSAAHSQSIKLVDVIPASLSPETNQDSEPFLAVDASNPNVMVVSAFSPNPLSNAGDAPVYVTQDAGNTWVLNTILPAAGEPCDVTQAMTPIANHPKGDLHAGTLVCAGQDPTLSESETPDVSANAAMTVRASRANVDQPFVRATTTLGSGRDGIYIGLNDLNQRNGRTATVDVSLDDGASYKSFPIEFRDTAGQDGPSVRPAVADDGTVYVAFFRWRSFDGSQITSDVVVVRDDNRASGPRPFQALTEPTDGLPGRLVVTSRTIPWSNEPTLGQERIGSTLSLVVDPKRSKIVYVAWAERVGNGDVYTLHVRRSTDSGASWSPTDLPHTTIMNATNAALAVAADGTVAFLYQELSDGRWVTHLVQSRDAFANVQDTILATTPSNDPPVKNLPYLGDYDYVYAVGSEFRGVFCANNTPDLDDFPHGVRYQRAVDFASKRLTDGAGNAVKASIDPFYFSIPVTQ
jgi:hypothetical protein